MTNLPPPIPNINYQQHPSCAKCNAPLYGNFCYSCGSPHQAGPNTSIMCWNCGEQTPHTICIACGTDLTNKPNAVVDTRQASIDGAISGAIFGALISGKTHRARNATLGALYGSSNASTNAHDLNSAFEAGAPLTSIAKYQKRKLGYFAGLFLGWTTLLVIASAATVPGLIILTMPATWYLCKLMAKLKVWLVDPLHKYGVVKRTFGFWVQGDVALGHVKIVKHHKIYAIVLICLQIFMAGSSF